MYIYIYVNIVCVHIRDSPKHTHTRRQLVFQRPAIKDNIKQAIEMKRYQKQISSKQESSNSTKQRMQKDGKEKGDLVSLSCITNPGWCKRGRVLF
jgi:hypothetical protein